MRRSRLPLRRGPSAGRCAATRAPWSVSRRTSVRAATGGRHAALRLRRFAHVCSGQRGVLTSGQREGESSGRFDAPLWKKLSTV